MNVVTTFLTTALFMVTETTDTGLWISPSRVQTLHACSGSTVFIPWPLNVASRTGRGPPKVTLIFQRKHSETSKKIAEYNKYKQLNVDKMFVDRLSLSPEKYGLYLKRIMIDDAGTFQAQAIFDGGQTWTRTTNLTVHVRPMLFDGKLNISVSNRPTDDEKQHCQKVTCGTLEYRGYPPAQFTWTAPGKSLKGLSSEDGKSSSVHVCSPFVGKVTCSLGGFSSMCTFDQVISQHLEIPGPANISDVHSGMVNRDLILMIVMPVLAVIIPLTVFGIWLLSHTCKSYPVYRHQRQFKNHETVRETDVEDCNLRNQAALHMGNNIGVIGDGSQVLRVSDTLQGLAEVQEEQEFDEQGSDETDDVKGERDGESETDVKDGDISEDEDDEETSESSEDEEKTAEKQPLMMEEDPKFEPSPLREV